MYELIGVMLIDDYFIAIEHFEDSTVVKIPYAPLVAGSAILVSCVYYVVLYFVIRRRGWPLS